MNEKKASDETDTATLVTLNLIDEASSVSKKLKR